MATEAATAKDRQFVLVSVLPDVCLTPDRDGDPVLPAALAASTRCGAHAGWPDLCQADADGHTGV